MSERREAGDGLTIQEVVPSFLCFSRHVVGSKASTWIPTIPAPRNGPAVAPARILVLDDEPMIREFVARSLSEVGYEVVMLSPTYGAVQLVTETHFDLIITNSVMPAASGAQLVARLRSEFPQLPVLHLDDQAHPRPPEFPADVPTLHKPFSHDGLREGVARLLAG
jgi:CheY-like chemotaxis protein